MSKYNIKELIKDNFVKFDSFRQGNFYYILRTSVESTSGWTDEEFVDYQFIIPLDDIGTATLENEDKAITYMRWIRKSIENETFLKL